MHVAGLEPDPVHRRQVPHGVRHMGVLDELGAGRGAGGEVEHQRVVGPGDPVRLEPRVRPERPVEVQPPGNGVGALRVDRDPGVLPRHVVELGRVLGPHDHMPGAPALDPVPQIGRAQQRGRGDDDRPQLHRGQRGHPQFLLVAEHDDDAVPGPYSLGAQPVGDLVGAQGHLGVRERDLAAVLLDDVQRGGVVALGDDVEPVERPVEPLGARPGEPLAGRRVVLPVLQQEVPCGPELLRGATCIHVPSSLPGNSLPPRGV